MKKYSKKISVIICAYLRKEFIREAIESVLNQTLNKNLYEIIVVKNFKDKDIDKFISKNKIKNIYLDPKKAGYYGVKMAEGVKKANGEIICFLEDDDKFLPNKLEVVYKVFQNKNVGFYHNSYYILYKDKINKNVLNNMGGNFIVNPKKIEKQAIKNLMFSPSYFNTSLMSVRKSILDPNLLIKISPAADRDLWVLSLNSNMISIFDKIPLDLYRIHNSTFTPTIHLKNYSTFVNFIKSRAKLTIDTNGIFYVYKAIKIKWLKKVAFYHMNIFKLDSITFLKSKKLEYLKISFNLFILLIELGFFRKAIKRLLICFLFWLNPEYIRKEIYKSYVSEAVSNNYLINR